MGKMIKMPMTPEELQRQIRIPLEDCRRVLKDSHIEHMHQLASRFFNYIYKRKDALSEEELRAMLLAMCFVFRLDQDSLGIRESSPEEIKRYENDLHTLSFFKQKQKSETMTTITQEQAIELVKLNNPQHFVKFGEFPYVVAEEEQEVITTIKGKKETKNIAKPGDYIVSGVFGEKYAIKPAKFNSRYKDLGNGMAEAVGECWGNEYKHLPTKLIASWGEEQVIEPGDYLVSSDEKISEAYRIEREIFFLTYRPA